MIDSVYLNLSYIFFLSDDYLRLINEKNITIIHLYVISQGIFATEYFSGHTDIRNNMNKSKKKPLVLSIEYKRKCPSINSNSPNIAISKEFYLRNWL